MAMKTKSDSRIHVRFSFSSVMLATAALVVSVALPPAFGQLFEDINPDFSDTHGSDSDGATGGRVNHVAVEAGNTDVMYAASEWGGIYKSTDSGATWAYRDPTGPAGSANRIWDVLALGGGVVHVCGDDGHLRSDDGGTSWVAGSGLGSGRCSLAVSPDESYVLLAVAGTRIYETDNAASGTPTWALTRTNPSP